MTDFCEICRTEKPIVVVSSTLAAFSYAVCQKCISSGWTEPLWLVHNTFDCLAGDKKELLEKMHPSLENIKSFLDGRYILFDEILSLWIPFDWSEYEKEAGNYREEMCADDDLCDTNESRISRTETA